MSQEKESEKTEEKYDLRIRFIGMDQLYNDRLKDRFAKVYDNLKIKWDFENPVRGEFNPMHEYLSIVRDQVNILFFEPVYEYPKNIEFIKYLRRDERTKRVSTNVLHSFNVEDSYVRKITMAGARINQIKCDEFSSVIFGAMALFDNQLTKIPPTLFAPYEKNIHLVQEMRLSYLTDEYYAIETNSPILPGSEIEFEAHPWKKILKNVHFEVKELSEENLYYYKRYSLRVYPELEEPERYQKDIRRWINNSQGKVRPKRTKVLLADPYLTWFDHIDKSIRDIGFTVNYQTRIEGIENTLKRRRPQIIALALEKNNDDAFISISRILASIKTLNLYHPYLMILNCSIASEELRESQKYENIMSLPHLIKPAELKQMCESLEKKLIQSDDSSEKRHYYDSNQDHVTLKYHREIRILGMTESMIYFKSNQTIPDYTVFQLDHPVQAFVTTVPHFPVELKELEKPYYTGVINFTGEKSNSKLRFFLNGLIKDATSPKEEEVDPNGQKPQKK